MRNSCQAFMIRAVLIVCTLTVLLQAKVSVAQGDTAGSSITDAAAPTIKFVAGEAQVPNPQTDPFLQLLDRAIETTSKRTLTANSHSPWQIFHCILALRNETVLRLGDQKVNAIEWLSTAEPQFDKQPWLLLTPHGAKFHPYTRMYAFEGHPSQFLALLSQSNLPMDYPFHVQGKVVTLNDLVNNTMKEVNTKEEVTWVLWALQHFLKPDAVWVNQLNETWSIERLVKIESDAPVVGAPCGGNHRLFALTRARDKYLASGGQLRGVWFQADQKIKQHIEIARSLQNADGSFSSDSYKGPGHTTDVNKRFNTTGHTMEFLAIGLPQERLSEPWVRNAVWMLSRELVIHRDTKIDCGPLFHSLDALILYRERIRGNVAPSEGDRPADSVVQKTPVQIADPQPKLDSLPKPVQNPAARVTEPKKVAQLPDDVKPGTPELQSVPIPIPEPVVIPEPKTEQPKLELPTVPVPQAKSSKPNLPKTVAMKPQDRPSKSDIPRIDPAKLPNVGQVATPRKATETASTVRRDRNLNTAPALLPESSATPLPSPKAKPPIPITLPDEPDLGSKLQPGSLGSDHPEPTSAGPSGAALNADDPSAPVLIDAPSADEDEPVSALQPTNH